MAEREEYTLYHLTEIIKLTLSSTFDEPLWVVAEINRFSIDPRKGHVYMELVEKDKENDRVIAQMRATIWASNRARVLQKFELFTDQEFRAGIKILVRGYVNYHNVYGLSFNVIDIDPEYTIGDMHRRKIEVIRQLQQEGIFDMNKELELPLVIQRIAVISSEQAAGYEDFVNHLEKNSYGFVFYHKLFTAYMQGENAEASIISALDRIYQVVDNFDVVVIIRGGGSRTDLSVFDSYDLAANVAQFPLPVITGIGHTRDESVVDMVARLSMKTPTAVADFIVKRASDFAADLMDLKNSLIRATQLFISNKKLTLSVFNNRFREGVSSFLWRQKYRLQEMYSLLRMAQLVPRRKKQELIMFWDKIPANIEYNINTRKKELMKIKDELEEAINKVLEVQRNSLERFKIVFEQNDPKKVLQKGFSITLHNGKVLTSAEKVSRGDTVETILFDGKIISEVKLKSNEE